MSDEGLFHALAEAVRDPDRVAIADTGRGSIAYGDLFGRAGRVGSGNTTMLPRLLRPAL